MLESRLTENFKTLLPYLRPSLATLIDWKPLVPKALKQSFKSLSGSEYERVKAALRPRVPERVRWGDGLAHPIVPSALDETERVFIGQTLLEIYFAQLRGDTEFFLDLRLERFSADFVASALTWCPNRLWWKLEPSFQKHLSSLYRAYYGGDAAGFREALGSLRLLPKHGSTEASDRIVKAFYGHFGSGDQSAVRFKLGEFNDSFERILTLMREHDVQVPGEFAIVGLYLVGLYSALESLDVTLNVRAAYESSGGTRS